MFDESCDRQSPLQVALGFPGYVLKVDTDMKHCLKEAPHWHLYFNGKAIARITNYGCWTSWPLVSQEIRLKAEALTRKYIVEIAHACGQSTINPTSEIQQVNAYYATLGA